MRGEVEIEFVKWFSELSNKDISVAGGKGASLAEMFNHKFPVPPGFVITAQSYKYFLDKAGITGKINNILENLDVEDTKELDKVSKEIRSLIESSVMPKDLETSILEAYDVLDISRKEIFSKARGQALDILKTGQDHIFVAVRSSATTEDLVDASFAGQQDSFLNVKGERELIDYVKKCFSSLFTARAIYYRTKKGFEHSKSYLAVVIQRMIDSDKSGVIFSKNPVSGEDSIVIEAVFGLGEGIVSGMIRPDNYVTTRDFEDFKVLSTEISDKKIAMVRSSSGKNEVVNLSEERSTQQVLSSYEIKRLAQYSMELENHYGKPQDIEFAIEGGHIFIVQSRPITVISKQDNDDLTGEVILKGYGASPGRASGKVRIIHNEGELSKIKKGEVLVTKMTNPDMVVAMEKAAAIITDDGGLTSHAAIVSREMGIPSVVGTIKATQILKDGDIVGVDGSKGVIYRGVLEKKEVEIKKIVSTKTKIKVIVDIPEYASRAALSGANAIGLVRLEGIIAYSGKHPLKFVKDKNMDSYKNIILNGLKKISEKFEEVWIRSSDLRSDEYSKLDGAPKIVEGNPMLGDHGIRFSLKYPELLKAEISAVKELALNYKNKIFGFMMPQIISVDELKRTKEIASLIDIPENVKMGIMVETPAAVQIIEELCEEGMDFISFGTNDLTQYTLAIDRNNPDVQHLHNEMNPAILKSIKRVIEVCRKHGVETSICGQAGSKPEMAKFLVENGIDSISVNADAAHEVSKVVAEVEKNFRNYKVSESSSGENVNGKKDSAREFREEKESSEKDSETKVDGEGEKQEEFVLTEAKVLMAMNKVFGDAEEDIEDIILRQLDDGSEGAYKQPEQTQTGEENQPLIDVMEDKVKESLEGDEGTYSEGKEEGSKEVVEIIKGSRDEEVSKDSNENEAGNEDNRASGEGGEEEDDEIGGEFSPDSSDEKSKEPESGWDSDSTEEWVSELKEDKVVDLF